MTRLSSITTVQNVWLGRFPRHGLDAESLRDSILALSGELDRDHAGGASLPAGRFVELHDPLSVQGRLRLEAPQRLPDGPAFAEASIPFAVRCR